MYYLFLFLRLEEVIIRIGVMIFKLNLIGNFDLPVLRYLYLPLDLGIFCNLIFG